MPSAKTAALAAAALLSATAQALSTGAPGRQVSVRFQNWAPGQSDVVTIASEGEVLMDVGDRVGVKIPRGCKTGICGTCTLDLIDPNYEGTLQTVRACCTIVQGNSEQRDLVVDCSRMGGSEETPSAGSDPMARFSDGWENDFKPDYREEQNDQLYQSVGIGDRRAEADTSMSGADFAVEATGEDEATARMRALLAAQQAVDDDVDVFGGTNYAAGPEMDLPEITPGDFVNFSPDAADAADAPAPQPQPQPQPQMAKQALEPHLRWRSAITGNPEPEVFLPVAEAAPVVASPWLRPAGVAEGSEMSRTAKPIPRLITLDATGTLIELHSRVGYHYREALVRNGADLRLPRPDVFHDAFVSAYKEQTARMPCFGIGSGLESFDWWRGVMTATYDKVFEAHGITDEEIETAGSGETKAEVMARVFEDLYYNVFAKAYPEGAWELKPGVETVLRMLKESHNCAGVKLGVLSNFDERLGDILESLGVAHFFDFVLTSREAGAEKPGSVMFDLARNSVVVDAEGSGNSFGVDPKECLHVGDTFGTDVRGAVDAGWQAGFVTDITKLLDSEDERQGLTRGEDFIVMGDLWPLLERYDLDVSQRDLVSTAGNFETFHKDIEIEVMDL